MLAMLKHESASRYAMTTDAEAEPGAVILTLAIRDKATCELRMPKSRYDGLKALELLEGQR